MAEAVLEMAAKMAKYIGKKGFAEIFIRDSKGRCVSIGKALLKSAGETQKNKVAEAVMQVAKQIGLSDSGMADFQKNLLEMVNPQTVRKELAKIAKNQEQNNAALKNLVKSVSGIYSAVSSIQAVAWLNVALSAANLAATVVSTVIICDKLDHIDKKLDRIEGKIDAVKRVQFVTQVKQPCRSVIKDYKVIASELEKGKEVSETRMLEVINQCSDELEKIFSLRWEFNTGDVLELLYDLMPVLTDLIVQYYQHYFDESQGEYVLHQDWMKIYDMLDSEDFRNQVQDYLIIDQKMGNAQVNEILDCQHLITKGSKQKIEETLSDIRECDSLEDYQDIMEFSRQYALQQSRTIEAEMKKRFEEPEAEQIMAQAKQQYMFAG